MDDKIKEKEKRSAAQDIASPDTEHDDEGSNPKEESLRPRRVLRPLDSDPQPYPLRRQVGRSTSPHNEPWTPVPPEHASPGQSLPSPRHLDWTFRQPIPTANAPPKLSDGVTHPPESESPQQTAAFCTQPGTPKRLPVEKITVTYGNITQKLGNSGDIHIHPNILAPNSTRRNVCLPVPRLENNGAQARQERT
ncbi:hypothetical protein U1Q18_052770 [Sarracenia purpurea var. burkii]